MTMLKSGRIMLQVTPKTVCLYRTKISRQAKKEKYGYQVQYSLEDGLDQFVKWYYKTQVG